MKRNARRGARTGTPAWSSLAYVLWRRKHLDWPEIARHLEAEGWYVTRAEVADEVLRLAGDELRAGWERRAGR